MLNKYMYSSSAYDKSNRLISQSSSNDSLDRLLDHTYTYNTYNGLIASYRTQNDLKKYCSYLIINILDQNNKSISEIDEPNSTLMVCETICFVNCGCINGIDLTTDKEFFESLENLVNQVKEYV